MTVRDTILNGSSSSPSSSDSSSRHAGGAEEGEGFRSVLTVPTKTRHDSQVFFCLASNVYGNDTKKINLIVQGEGLAVWEDRVCVGTIVEGLPIDSVDFHSFKMTVAFPGSCMGDCSGRKLYE